MSEPCAWTGCPKPADDDPRCVYHRQWVNFHGWWAPPEYVEQAEAVLATAPPFTEATRARLRVLLTGQG